MLRIEREQKTWIFSAHRNLLKLQADNLRRPWDVGISSLVGLSGETLSIHDGPVNCFQTSHVCKSALIVSLKVKTDVIGLLAMARKADKPFSQANQHLLEAVADYASISLKLILENQSGALRTEYQ